MPEPCKSCVQAKSGETDNWEPRQECKTCRSVICMVDLYPCSGCSLNADPAHQGKNNRWEWKDAPKSAETSDAPGDVFDAPFCPSPVPETPTVQP